MTSQYGIGGAASAQENLAHGRAGDQQAIERQIAEFVAAWNRHDPAQMAAVWAEDGDLINPFGRAAHGRDQVRQLFREEHQSTFKNCSHEMDVESVRLLGNDLAIADGNCTLSGARSPDGQEMPTFRPHVALVFGKKEGNWQVLAARAYNYASEPGQAT